MKKLFILFSVILICSALGAVEDQGMCSNDPIINTGICKHDAAGDSYCDFNPEFLMNCDGDIHF